MTLKKFKAVSMLTGEEFWPEHQGLTDGPDMKAPTTKKEAQRKNSASMGHPTLGTTRACKRAGAMSVYRVTRRQG